VLTATAASSGDYLSASSTLTVAAVKATPTLTVTGLTTTYNAEAHPATDTITGTNNDNLTSQVTLTYNSSSTVPVNVGSYAVTATFAANSNYNAVTNTSAQVIINAFTPTLTVADSGGTYNGQAFPATPTLTLVNGGSTDPNSVTLSYSGTTAAGATYSATSAAPTQAGTYSVVASIASGGNYAGATSPTVNFTIAKATPTLIVTGQTATYNAQAHPASFSITGVNGDNLTGLVGLTYNGTSTVPVNAGRYPVVASFPGSADYNSVTNSSAQVVINATPTTTTLTSSSSVVVPGQSVTFTAVVAPVSPGGGAPVGSVQFKNGSTVLGTVGLTTGTGSSQAVFTTSSLPNGNLTITALYVNSDGNSLNSTSSGLAESGLTSGVSVSGTTLYIIGGNTADFALVTPVGSSITGSTGAAISATLNNAFSTSIINQTLTSIVVDGLAGNDNFQIASTITLPVTLTDGNGNNSIQTGGGNDVITLGTGSNQVFGGGGNKTIIDQDAAGTTGYIQLGTGNDSISLGAGNDQVKLTGGVSTVTGGNGNDTVVNGNGATCIVLGNGNDYVNTDIGIDAMTLGNGNDTIVIGGGNATVTTGNGNDFISAGSQATGTDSITMGGGNDTVSLGNGTYNVTLGSGNDSVAAVSGNTTVNAGSGTDTVELGNGVNNVTLGNGNDFVVSGNGGTMVNVGTGNDTIELGNGPNSIALGNGNDFVSTGTGNTTLTGGNGNDTTQLGNGSDIVVEGSGTDNVSAGNGADLVVGGLGQHTIQLGNGNDILIDGNATVVNQGDSLGQILAAWNTSSSTSVNSRISVTYNATHPNFLYAGSGRNWFFYTNSKTVSNKKPTDRLN
jgi:hypothetical protein